MPSEVREEGIEHQIPWPGSRMVVSMWRCCEPDLAPVQEHRAFDCQPLSPALALFLSVLFTSENLTSSVRSYSALRSLTFPGCQFLDSSPISGPFFLITSKSILTLAGGKKKFWKEPAGADNKGKGFIRNKSQGKEEVN